jgi:hypothetical protein
MLKKSLKLSFAAAVSSMAVVPALTAQDSAPNLRMDGFVELGYLSGEDSTETAYALGDVTLSFGAEANSAAPGWGVEGSILGFVSEEFNREAIFLAVTYAGPWGRISAGVPRSPVSDIIPAVPLGGAYALDYSDAGVFGEFGFQSRELVDRIYTNRGTNPPLGIRYDRRVGNLTFGTSIHRFADAEYDAFTAAVRYDIFQTGISALASFEELHGTDGAPRFTSAMIGGTAELGSFTMGLMYLERDFIALDLDGTRSWITYRPNEAIEITGTAFNTNIDHVYGVSAQYKWPVGAYVQIGAVDGREQEALYDISVGWEF